MGNKLRYLETHRVQQAETLEAVEEIKHEMQEAMLLYLKPISLQMKQQNSLLREIVKQMKETNEMDKANLERREQLEKEKI